MTQPTSEPDGLAAPAASTPEEPRVTKQRRVVIVDDFLAAHRRRTANPSGVEEVV